MKKFARSLATAATALCACALLSVPTYAAGLLPPNTGSQFPIVPVVLCAIAAAALIAWLIVFLVRKKRGGK